MPKEYDERYQRAEIRGQEDPRPWDVKQVVADACGGAGTVVDLGCGTGAKTLHIAGDVESLIGVDPSERMRAAFGDNAKRSGADNVEVIDGRAGAIPFESGSVDVVVCLLSRFMAAECARVLKPNGLLILETTTDRDKRALKEAFASALGSQCGQFQGLRYQPFQNALCNEFNEYFSIDPKTNVQIGEWGGTLTRSGVEQLLTQTNVIRDFDPTESAELLDQAIGGLMTDTGVPVDHARLLLQCRRKDDYSMKRDGYSLWEDEISLYPVTASQQIL